MDKKIHPLIVLTSVLLAFITSTSIVSAKNCDEIKCENEGDQIECIKEKKSCWEDKISETQNSQVTLTNTISILSGQISIQQLQVQQTLVELDQLEDEVKELSERIGGLNISLDRLSSILVKRVGEQYKRTQVDPIFLLFKGSSLSNFLSEYKYIKLAKKQTLEAMHRAESQRLLYDEQKSLKEKKQLEVEAKKRELNQQQTQLTQQRADQQYLLNETKSNEARFQSELAKTLQELQAIQSIIAGQGNESEVGGVTRGATIASIISGASACSTGTHLHFEVVKDSSHQNPAGYLSQTDISWSNQPDGSFSFSGGWDWPVFDAARITQGYGMTWYARVKRAYGGSPHTGLDLLSKTSSDLRVRAVKDGTLYRGSISCGGGLLRYVHLKHKESGEETYYLHINY